MGDYQTGEVVDDDALAGPAADEVDASQSQGEDAGADLTIYDITTKWLLHKLQGELEDVSRATIIDLTVKVSELLEKHVNDGAALAKELYNLF